jgi:hypothetical protein
MLNGKRCFSKRADEGISRYRATSEDHNENVKIAISPHKRMSASLLEKIDMSCILYYTTRTVAQ